MSAKEKLHRLVDEIPESEVGTAERFLEYLRAREDPVIRALLDAPEDDEEESPREAEAVAEGREAYGEGDLVSDDEVRDQLES